MGDAATHLTSADNADSLDSFCHFLSLRYCRAADGRNYFSNSFDSSGKTSNKSATRP
jgi:hypothetical protein